MYLTHLAVLCGFFPFIFGDTEKRITSLCDIGFKTVEVCED